MSSPILALTIKETRHILRDRRSLAIVFLLPFFMVLLYGYAINLDLKNISLAVVDYDRSFASRNLVERMVNSGYFSVSGYCPDLKSADHLIFERRAKGVMVIPERFMRDSYGPEGSTVQLLLDGCDANTSTIAAGYFNMILASGGSGQEKWSADPAPFEVRPLVLYNPEMESMHFVVPGLVAIVLMMVCALMTSITIAREKETGTMEQILTSPVSPYQILLGKVTPYLVIAFLEVILIIGLAHFWFGVPVRGSFTLFLFMTLAYLFCCLSLGITISAMVNTQQVAMAAALVSTLLPSVMLSGFVFPLSSMPVILNWIGHAMPATYYLHIIRGIMLKGVGWAALWQDFAILLGMGFLIILFGMKKFRTKLG